MFLFNKCFVLVQMQPVWPLIKIQVALATAVIFCKAKIHAWCKQNYFIKILLRALPSNSLTKYKRGLK
mgnify:CR=1 FL=1